MERWIKESGWLLLILLVLHGLSVCATEAEAKASASASNKQRYTALINSIAKRYGVETALVHALIKVESNYNPDAVSRAGAVGLMQLMPETAAEYGVGNREELFDPATNVDAGTRHLKRLLRKYKNIARTLTAYNAGEGSAVTFRTTGAYTETRRYVVRVVRYYQKYKGRGK